MMSDLTHFDAEGGSRMVDVGAKQVTHRVARARGRVRMKNSTLDLLRNRKLAKGDVLEVARLAGIMAAKRKPLEEKEASVPESRLLVEVLEYPAERPEGRVVGEGPDVVPELVRLLREEAKVL